MIPKKIHYCWLSGEPIPEKIQMCLDSWRRILPNYEIILWDTNKFDVSKHKFVLQACENRKWAFAADYIRVFALYTEGGIYLDSDVFVLKNFDNFLDNEFFTSIECHIEKLDSPETQVGFQAAVMGSKPGHSFLKKCLEYYNNADFISGNGSFNQTISPIIYANIAAKNFGFKFVNKPQKLKEGMLILSREIFAGSVKQKSLRSYAVHLCNGSWRDRNKTFLFSKTLYNKIKYLKIKYLKLGHGFI